MKQIESIEDDVKTCVFRKHKGEGAIIALFPLVPSALAAGESAAYSEPTGWGSADIGHLLAVTVPAIETEYAPLHLKLKRMGHSLNVRSYEDMLAFPDAAPPKVGWQAHPTFNEAAHLVS